MNYNFKNIAFLVLLYIPCQILCQTPEANLQKYWDYRDQFYDSHIVDIEPSSIPIGAPKNGINIPTGIINNTNIGRRQFTVSWGDATVGLAWYISLLASEYKLQRYQGQDVSLITQRIYRAMDALNRLDDNAEPEFGCGEYYTREYSGSGYTNINGFFIRDDVDNAFFEYWASHGKTSWIGLGPKSDYLDPDPRKKEMSQDQVWHLLLGFALVKEFVDSPDLFEDSPGVFVTLKDMAKRQTYRILTYMQSSYQQFGLGDEPLWNWCHVSEDCYPGDWDYNTWSAAAWRVKNPCTGDTVSRGGSYLDLQPFLKLFASAGNWITDMEWGDLNYGTGGFNPPLVYSDQYFNNTGLLTLSTIGDTVYAASNDLLFWNIRKCAAFFNYSIPGNPFDLKYFWLDHLPLIRILFHDDPPLNQPFFDYFFSHVESLLNEAPPGGPQNYTLPPSNYLWSQPEMLSQPVGVAQQSTRDDLFGNYSGIDYMLLYNLFNLVYIEKFRRNVTINYDFPTTYTYLYPMPSGYGDQTRNIGHEDDEVVLTINCKFTITMNSIVQSTGKVHLRGGDIVLNPGFEVKSGGEFEAPNFKLHTT